MTIIYWSVIKMLDTLVPSGTTLIPSGTTLVPSGTTLVPSGQTAMTHKTDRKR